MDPRSIAAVILAGGAGTRVRHLLPDLPKPMAPAAGCPFIQWVAHFLKQQGITRILISTGYKGETIATHFASSSWSGPPISCISESTPMGTAGGFFHAVRASGLQPKAWLVLNGDSLALTPLSDLFKAIDLPTWDGSLLGVHMKEASRYGTLTCAADGRLQAFAEKRPGAGLINAGVYLLKNSIVRRFDVPQALSFETDVFPTLLAQGTPLRVIPVNAPFLDIGTPETLMQAERFISSHAHFFSEGAD